MTSRARTARSRQTEHAIADYLVERGLYPQAVRVPAALPGRDILNTPGVAIEVKARRDLNLLAWLRQAEKNASPGEVPAVASRPDGIGVENVDNWPVTIRLKDFVSLLERAGYGA